MRALLIAALLAALPSAASAQFSPFFEWRTMWERFASADKDSVYLFVNPARLTTDAEAEALARWEVEMHVRDVDHGPWSTLGHSHASDWPDTFRIAVECSNNWIGSGSNTSTRTSHGSTNVGPVHKLGDTAGDYQFTMVPLPHDVAAQYDSATLRFGIGSEASSDSTHTVLASVYGWNQNEWASSTFHEANETGLTCTVNSTNYRPTVYAIAFDEILATSDRYIGIRVEASASRSSTAQTVFFGWELLLHD